MSISSSFRSNEKLKNDHVTSLNFWKQFPLGQVGFLLRYFSFARAFEGQVLVQLVIARSAMGEVSRSISKCDLQSFFRLLSFSCYLLACVVLVWRAVQAKAGDGCETARRLGRGQ